MDLKYRTVPDELWRAVEPLLPERPTPRGGRPGVPDRHVLAGIIYRLRTGCQCHLLPSEFGSGSTGHLRLQQGVEAGVFTDAFLAMRRRDERRHGIAWKWAALDALTVTAPKGGPHGAESNGPGEAGWQAPPPDRWPRDSTRRCAQCGPCAGQVDAGRDARQHGDACGPLAAQARASLPRPRLLLSGLRGSGARSSHSAAHTTEGGAAAGWSCPRDAKTMRSGANRQLVQPLPRSPGSLGGESSQRPGALPPGMCPPRVTAFMKEQF